MTTIVDLDTGQVLGTVDGQDHKGVGDWLFARPLAWRLGVQVVAIDPSVGFRKALRMWLPRTEVSVDLFHVTMLANDMLTTVRQGLSQQVRGRRGRATDPAWADRKLLLKARENLSERGRHRLVGVFAVDDPDRQPSGRLARAAMPETNTLYRTVCRWWTAIEVLIITGATTAKA